MSEQTKALVNGGYPLHTFEDVESIYERYISSVEDRELIKKAYDFIIEKEQDYEVVTAPHDEMEQSLVTH